MGIIKETLDVDFEFDPKPLTKKDKEQISNYIKAYKEKQSQKNKRIKKANPIILKRKKVIA